MSSLKDLEWTVFAKVRDGQRFKLRADVDVWYVRCGRWYRVWGSLGNHRMAPNTVVYAERG